MYIYLPEPVNHGVNPSHSVGRLQGIDVKINKPQNTISSIMHHLMIRGYIVNLKTLVRRERLIEF